MRSSLLWKTAWPSSVTWSCLECCSLSNRTYVMSNVGMCWGQKVSLHPDTQLPLPGSLYLMDCGGQLVNTPWGTAPAHVVVLTCSAVSALTHSGDRCIRGPAPCCVPIPYFETITSFKDIFKHEKYFWYNHRHFFLIQAPWKWVACRHPLSENSISRV